MADHILSPRPLRPRALGALTGVVAPVGIGPFTEAKACARDVRKSMERPRPCKIAPRGADGCLRTGVARWFSPKSLDDDAAAARRVVG